MNTIKAGGVTTFWQYVFLLKTFFGHCEAHNDTLNNHENQYCIDCETAACQHCLKEGFHANHRVLTLYRLVYSDVVTLDEIIKHMDCSAIQPYMSNGKLVLALSPLPHQGSGTSKPRLSCVFCARKLMDPTRFCFCSIACKFGIKTGKSTSIARPSRPAPPNSSRDIIRASDTDNNTSRGGVGANNDTNGDSARKIISIARPPRPAPPNSSRNITKASDTDNNTRKRGGVGAANNTNGGGASASATVDTTGGGADTNTNNGSDNANNDTNSLEMRRRLLLGTRRRKGIPKRAPLF